MAQAKRKKRFFDIEIPVINRETQVQAYEIPELGGRLIDYDMTRTLKGKSAMLQLKIKADGNNLTAVPVQLKILPYFLRRMMRKGTNYVEDSFSAETKDAKVLIKPFLITRRKVSRSIRKSLRDRTREEIKKYLSERNSAGVFEDLVKNDFQRALGANLKKIYPLSFCEIRIFKVEKEK